MALVDLLCLILLLLILWVPFEWVAHRVILRAIRLWNRMDSDVDQISDELDKGKHRDVPPPVTPLDPTKDKKDKTKKGV